MDSLAVRIDTAGRMDHRRVGAANVAHHRPEADLVFVFAHPGTSYLDHFLVEPLVAAGAGVLGVDNRYVGQATDLSMLTVLDDLVEAVQTCVPPRARVVLVGHSGGGPLMTLARVRLGLGHALALLAAHPSRGHILADWIDPAVTEDGRDARLDLFAKPLPLDDGFVQAYRRAQVDRVRRIARTAAAALREGRPLTEVSFRHCCADPRFVDRTLDANERDPTAFPFGGVAEANARPEFMGGVSTARAFFDQWFVPTTPANGLALAPYVEGPILHLAFGADQLVFPSQSAAWTQALPDHAEVGTVAGARHNPRGQTSIVASLADRLVRFARAI